MNLKNRNSIRLKNYDYSSNGAYFVTICTQDRQELFGFVGAHHDAPNLQPTMILNQYGKIIDHIVKLLAERFPMEIDTYQIMPNHIHMIIIIVGAHHDAPVNHAPTIRAIHESPLQRSLLSQIIGFLKMNSSKSIHQIDPNLPIWQRNFYEHIIRNEIELYKIREYIELNTSIWKRDRNNMENIYV